MLELEFIVSLEKERLQDSEVTHAANKPTLRWVFNETKFSCAFVPGEAVKLAVLMPLERKKGLCMPMMWCDGKKMLAC